MKTLYLALADKLLSIPAFIPDEVSDKLIKHIDRYNAQPEFTEGVIPFHLPAVFIEFAEVRWDTLPAGIQKGYATIRLHILQYALQDSSMDAYGQEATEMTDALRLWDTMDAIHQAVQGFSGGDDAFSWSALRRITSRSDTRHNILSLDLMEYSTLLHDASASISIPTHDLPPIEVIGEIVEAVTPPAPYNPNINGFVID